MKGQKIMCRERSSAVSSALAGVWLAILLSIFMDFLKRAIYQATNTWVALLGRGGFYFQKQKGYERIFPWISGS